jgi:hypothetical protein
MTYHLRFTFLALVVLIAVSLSTGQEKEKLKEKNKKEITVTGEVIDVKCYLTGMMGGRGEDHKQCAIDCAKGGLPLGILEDKTERVYTVVPKGGMKGPNDDLVQYIARKVTLTGIMVEKGEQKMLFYTKVEASKD